MTSSAKSFRSFFLLRANSAGELLRALQSLGEKPGFEIIDVHHLLGVSHAMLALHASLTDESQGALAGFSELQCFEILDPHPEFLDHYLHLQLADHIAGPVSVVESTDYVEFCQALNAALRQGARVLDLFWSRAGGAQGLLILTQAEDQPPVILPAHWATRITRLPKVSRPISCFLTGKNPRTPDIS